MLTGLAGAAVPLVLHLLARSRYRSVDWGAMMFLAGTQQRQRQSARLRQWLLLAMRMLIVALVALAMARPVLRGWWRAAAPSGHVDAVILLDTSASMVVVENGTSRMDLARRAAVSVIAQLQRGDQVAIVPMGSSREATALSSDLQQVAQDAATLTPEDGKADIAAGLAAAAEILETGNSQNREIYIISDHQAVNWDSVNDAFGAGWRRRWEDGAAPAPRILLLPMGGEDRANAGVEAFVAQGLPAVIRQPVELEIRVRNYGAEPVSDLPVTISDGAKELYRNTINLPGASATVLRTAVSFESVGCRVLTAEIKGDGMPFDDRRDLAVLVAPPVEVLVVSGDEREGLWRKESDFLQLALAPWASAGEKGPDPVKVTVISPLKWQRPDPRKYPVLILANVASVSDEQARELEQYVYSGGGLIVTAGNLVQSNNYNALLYRDGSGILPAWLWDSMSTQAMTPQRIIGIELGHPIFRFLRGRPDPVPTVNIARHLPVVLGKPEARTLMTLGNGEPLLLERTVGRGHVLLLTSSIDADWNSLPLSGFYLPLVQSMVKYLAAAQLPEMNMARGQPIVLSVDGIAEEGKPKITRPDGTEDDMEIVPSTLSGELRYEKTRQTGRYSVDLNVGGTKRQWTFVVQPATEESNLESYTDAQLQQWRKLLGFEVLDLNAESLAGAVGAERKGRELWLWLIVAALGLCGVELWFARRCSAE